jgi:hypothetical protein
LSATDPASAQVPLAFSALPADAAVEVEPAFARTGTMICSNASSYRMESDVSILFPEVNPEQAKVIEVNADCALVRWNHYQLELYQHWNERSLKTPAGQFWPEESLCRFHAGSFRRRLSGRLVTGYHR